MPKTLEAITHDVLELPRSQQLALVHYLLDLDDGVADTEIEAAWETEIVTRLEAYREGKLECVPYEQVKAEIESMLRECK